MRLLSFAARAGNPYGIPVGFRLLDAAEHGLSSAVIVGERTWIAGKVRRVPHAEEAFGYTFENVLLQALSMGAGSCWIAGTMNRSAFEKAMDLGPDEVMPCVSPLGEPADRMSLRETMMRRAIRADGRLPFGELFFDGDFAHPRASDPSRPLDRILELVRRAPSAVNKQPWRVVVCGDKVHFYEKKNKAQTGSWDVQLVDLGIALCHFALTARESGLALSFLQEDPGLACPAGTAYVASYSIS
jgi:nitroreductase